MTMLTFAHYGDPAAYSGILWRINGFIFTGKCGLFEGRCTVQLTPGNTG